MINCGHTRRELRRRRVHPCRKPAAIVRRRGKNDAADTAKIGEAELPWRARPQMSPF
jgi:hypothetical protein